MNNMDESSPEKLLSVHRHRPYPLPLWPWFAHQRWENVLFLHWPVSPRLLSTQIPPELELDVYDGTAWIGLVLFQVKDMHPRQLPALPWFRSYLQVNVRTYVTYNGRGGVYFFTLDVEKWPARAFGKMLYSLPFRKAKIKMEKRGQDVYFVNRWEKKQWSEELVCTYTPVSSLFSPKASTLDDWLIERYCLWSKRKGKLLRTDIHHVKWKLQKAEANIYSNSMASFLPRTIFQQSPLIHYAAGQQALFWYPIEDI